MVIVSSHLQWQYAAKEEKEGLWILVGLGVEVINPAGLIERSQDHVLKLRCQLIGGANLAPTSFLTLHRV